jgi:uncharacterized membrane protein YoaT (DUF817 family)
MCFAVVLMRSGVSFKESGELASWDSSGQRFDCLNVSFMYFSVSINTFFACWKFLKDLFDKETLHFGKISTKDIVRKCQFLK